MCLDRQTWPWCLSMEDLLGDGKLLKQVLQAGESDGPCPELGDRVQVHYSCRLSSASDFLDDSRGRGCPTSFLLGQGEVILGWEHALPSMRRGERAALSVHPDLAFGEAGCAGGAVPSTRKCEAPEEANLHFEIELLEVQRGGSHCGSLEQLSEEERLLEASRCKDNGNALFKAGQAREAAEAYRQALQMLGLEAVDATTSSSSGDANSAWRDELRQDSRQTLALACRLNLCQCLLKLEEHVLALQQASAALEMEPGNAKALYRRGLARLGHGQYQQAKADLLEAAKKEPRNAEIRAQLQECQKRLQDANEQQKQVYGGFFGQGGTHKEAVSGEPSPRL